MKLSDLSTDFDSIAQDIEDDIKARGSIGKSLFPGEAGSLLRDLGAAIFTALSYRIETAQQNSFMPTAFSKSSVYALASTLGAAPNRKKGATMSATLTVVSTLTSNVVIPKYTRFSARDLTWYTRQDYTLTSATTTLDIVLYQGEPTTETFNGNGQEFQQLLLAEGSFNVEEAILEVLVNDISWTRERNGLFEYSEASVRDVFLEDTTPEGKVKIVFGNGTYGNVPVLSDVITVKYAITVGDLSNSSIIGDSVDLLDAIDIGGGNDLEITTVSTSTSSGGSEEDSVELLKFTSPRIFAANKRAVRRSDYEGFLRSYTGVLAGKVWGEYEEAFKRGFSNNSMLNRVFFTAIKNDLTSQTESVGTGDSGTNIYNKTLSNLIPVPGSLIITTGTSGIDWYDIGSYLVSDDVTFNLIDGMGTSSADNEAGSNTADKAFDGDTSTKWQSTAAPSDSVPIHLAYDFGGGNETDISSIRIQSSDEVGTEARAFPSLISISGSNLASPTLNDDADWTVLKGNTVLQDPGVRSWTKWIKIDSSVAYRHIRIKILGRVGSSAFVNVGNVELQDISDASTIVYSTGVMRLNYSNAVLATMHGEAISAKFLMSDYTTSEITDIKTYFENLKHMTTLMEYQSPLAIPQDISVDVYYLENVINPNTLKTQIETALTNLLAINSESFERDLKLSDISYTVKAVTGVDYVDIKTPIRNVVAELGEFIILNTLTVNVYRAER